jgi:hypothetical protein
MKAEEALKICMACPMLKNTKFMGLKFKTCGKFMKKVEGESCGCVIELKTLLNELTECPQKKW